MARQTKPQRPRPDTREDLMGGREDPGHGRTGGGRHRACCWQAWAARTCIQRPPRGTPPPRPEGRSGSAVRRVSAYPPPPQQFWSARHEPARWIPSPGRPAGGWAGVSPDRRSGRSRYTKHVLGHPNVIFYTICVYFLKFLQVLVVWWGFWLVRVGLVWFYCLVRPPLAGF